MYKTLRCFEGLKAA